MLRLSLGDLVTWEGDEYAVVAASAGAVLLYRLSDGRRVWADMATIAANGDLSLRPAVTRHVTGSGAGEPLTGDEAERALWWEAHLNEVIHGVPDPGDSAAVPRPGYGEESSKTSRQRVKAGELTAAGTPVTVRTLRRKEAAYRADGLRGLLDHRVGNARPARVDPRVVQQLLAVLEDTGENSTVSVATLIDRVRARLTVVDQGEGDPVVIPSTRTLRRLVDRYDPRGLARGKATTRHTAGNRPARGPAPLVATYPGELVEIDSTPVNALALMSDGSVSRPTLTALLDVATRSVLGFALVPSGATGVEHADLLARVLRPRQCRPGAPEWMRLDASPVLPGKDMTALDPRQVGAIAMPYIVPETITTDRGRDYLSVTFVAACKQFGISLTPAPPGSPTFKTHIERFFESADTLWMQKLPGYVGSDATRRGQHPDRDGLLTLAQMADSFQQWWIRVWQNRPHDGLRDRDVPSRSFTPNQMYAAMFDACAGIPVPIDQDTYIALMPVHRRVLQPGAGFRVNHLSYWSDRLGPLTSRRPGTWDGKWEVHLDPYDTDRAWVTDPDGGDWIECVTDSYRTDRFPFASNLRALRGMPPGDPRVQQDWAAETIAAQARSSGRPGRPGISRRRQLKKTTVLAARAGDPRPGPPPDPVPPAPAPCPGFPGEFQLITPDEGLWDEA